MQSLAFEALRRDCVVHVVQKIFSFSSAIPGSINVCKKVQVLIRILFLIQLLNIVPCMYPFCHSTEVRICVSPEDVADILHVTPFLRCKVGKGVRIGSWSRGARKTMILERKLI